MPDSFDIVLRVTVENAEPSIPNVQNVNLSKERLIVAGFLSASVPGAGQFLAGRKLKGVFVLLVFAGLVFLFWATRIPSALDVLYAFALAQIVLCIFASVDACFSGTRLGNKPSQWWVAALLCAAVHLNWEMAVTSFRSYGIPSASMEPTIRLGESVVVDLRYFRRHPVERQDLVIFTLQSEPGIFFLKRTVALPGDTIRGEFGKVWLNGQLLDESYALREGDPLPGLDNFAPLTVPPGKLFVLGDNRNLSRDSRSPDFGLVEIADLRGKPLYVIPTVTRGGNPRILR